MKKNLFKTLFAATLLAGSSFLASCDSDAGIEIGIPQTQVQIFEVDGAGNVNIDTTMIVPSNLDSVLAADGTTLAGQNFTSIKELQLKVGKIGPNEPLVTAAGADSAGMAAINTGNPIKLPLPPAGFDFLQYVAQPQFRVNMVGKLVNPITTTFFIKAEISLNVRVKL